LLRSLRSLRADRALEPTTSSSLRDEERVPSLLLSTSARDPVVRSDHFSLSATTVSSGKIDR